MSPGGTIQGAPSDRRPRRSLAGRLRFCTAFPPPVMADLRLARMGHSPARAPASPMRSVAGSTAPCPPRRLNCASTPPSWRRPNSRHGSGWLYSDFARKSHWALRRSAIPICMSDRSFAGGGGLRPWLTSGMRRLPIRAGTSVRSCISMVRAFSTRHLADIQAMQCCGRSSPQMPGSSRPGSPCIMPTVRRHPGGRIGWESRWPICTDCSAPNERNGAPGLNRLATAAMIRPTGEDRA